LDGQNAVHSREAVTIAERKQCLISIFGNVAEISGGANGRTVRETSLRDGGVSAGIATDKFLALLGEKQTEVAVPHSRRALKTFWVDLTHKKPIFP
jgi:hypothetical protein